MSGILSNFETEDWWFAFLACTTAIVTVAVYNCIRKFVAGGVCRCTERMDGKGVIITGANTGLGKATAIALAKKGARVVLACRDLDKAEAAAAEIKRLSGNSQIVIAKLDLTSLTSVRRFCEYIKKSEKRVDVLINNAGVYYVPRSVTEDGHEMQFQANYLGHFLLTLLMLNKMLDDPTVVTRVINVSSVKHNQAIDFDDLDGAMSYAKNKRYAQTKLAQILFTRHLARKFKAAGDTKITVNCLHPGIVLTEIARDFPLTSSRIVQILTWPLGKLLLKTPCEGSQTIVHCAVSDECSTITGRYFKDCKVAEPNAVGTDDQQAEQLWNVSLKLVGVAKDDPAISGLKVTSKKSE